MIISAMCGFGNDKERSGLASQARKGRGEYSVAPSLSARATWRLP